MGAVFELRHANLIGYLTSEGRAVAPRATQSMLVEFLDSLTTPYTLISSTMGTPDDWTQQIAETAMLESNKLVWDESILAPAEVSRRLDPLRRYFTGYDLYAMVLPSGSWEQDERSFRFFTEVALVSYSRGLVLMPRSVPDQLTEVIDPFPALRALAETPMAPPAVVFWTRRQHPCVLPLKDAQHFYRTELVKALDDNLQLDQILQDLAKRRRTKRILHLSDLHFGKPEAGRRRSWLKEQLISELGNIDRVVVTGDLFDNPQEPLRESFDEFRVDVENMTHKDILVIPGNHDVRRKGNALGRLGRDSQYVTDLRWDPVVFDDDLQTVFFSFNSSETGNLAKGAVGERQRLDRGLLFGREVRRRADVGAFLRIALVHHHPFAYGSAPTTLYERILDRLFGGEERFIAFDGAQDFLEWCAARGVSLILHGHKHVPHWAVASVHVRDKSEEITIIGCGSSTGVDGKPMCYDIVTLDPSTKRWNALFFHDEKGDGSGFGLQNVTLDLRA